MKSCSLKQARKRGNWEIGGSINEIDSCIGFLEIRTCLTIFTKFWLTYSHCKEKKKKKTSQSASHIWASHIVHSGAGTKKLVNYLNTSSLSNELKLKRNKKQRRSKKCRSCLLNEAGKWNCMRANTYWTGSNTNFRSFCLVWTIRSFFESYFFPCSTVEWLHYCTKEIPGSEHVFVWSFQISADFVDCKVKVAVTVASAHTQYTLRIWYFAPNELENSTCSVVRVCAHLSGCSWVSETESKDKVAVFLRKLRSVQKFQF